MQKNFFRASESLAEDVLLADGWNFAGVNLYAHPERSRNEAANQRQAIKETLGRHTDEHGNTWLSVYGESPTDEQLVEILHQLNLILDPQTKISMLETSLNKILIAVEESDGRIQDVFDFIKEEVSGANAAMELDQVRRSMRNDYKY